MLDTLSALKELVGGGFNEKQAESIIHIVAKINDELATKGDTADIKSDITRLEGKTKSNIAESERTIKSDITRLEGQIKSVDENLQVKIGWVEEKLSTLTTVSLSTIVSALITILFYMLLTR